jgi:hypothetical protein
MIRLQIKTAYAGLLQARGLGNYRQIMQTSDGEVIEEDDLCDIRCLDLGVLRLSAPLREPFPGNPVSWICR